MRDVDDLLDEFERPRPPERIPYLKWIVIAAALVGLWVLASVATNIYTDYLWFQEVGYVSVFLRIISARVGLFVIGALLFVGLLLANVYLARRFSPDKDDAVPLPNVPADAVVWLRHLLGLGIGAGAVILAIIFGVAAASSWEQALRFWNSLPFGVTDPLYNKDVSFYIFSLPFFRFTQGWLLAGVIVSAVASLAIYSINFALGGFRFDLTPAIRAHLSGLGAAFFLLLAWGYWFEIYELVYSDRGAAYGASYADVNARLPVLRLLIGIAFVAGGVLVYNVFRQSVRIPLIAAGVWIGVVILGTGVYPAVVQRFQVEPNEFAKEQQFIEYTIDMTRKAYALDRIDIQPHEVATALDSNVLANNPLTVNNIRLWDHRPLESLYNQIQFFELYYAFEDIDVDRYIVDGEYRQVMVGAREITGPPPDAQTWVNQKLQYTHGYGIAMSPATEFTEKGEPEFFIEDIPSTGLLPVTVPQIYYGELTDEYVVVNTEQDELDHPGENGPVYQSYAGSGGILLDSSLKRLLFSWRLGDLNLLVSGAIKPDSRLLFIRGIQDRVQHIAPFLTLDRDPYMIVDDDGRLFWIQDAYTRTSRYPYSEPFTADTNYVRNSVKVVIDAYNGTSDFYIADEDDGMIQTFDSMFPGLLKPFADMPPVVRDHLRYPQDFFETQSQMYLKYHMTDNQVFYNEEDLWGRPVETFLGNSIPMEPYYVMMRLPDGEREEFMLIFPFTPFERPNLAGWLAARNDGENYGSLVAFAFQSQGRVGQIDGPEQIEAAIASNTEISSQFTLWRGASGSDNPDQGTDVLQGNLLVIPIGDTIIYVEPVYLQPRSLALPSLTAVIVVSQDKEPVMAPTLDEALSKLLGDPTVDPPDPGTGDPPIPGSPADLQEALQKIQEALRNLQNELDALSGAVDDVLDLTEEESATE